MIATDTDGDDTWDGSVTINTGTLAPGERAPYDLRITIPALEPTGNIETTSLIATSSVNSSIWACATDETSIVSRSAHHPVILLPDNSGVADSGGTEIYNHRVINNTGVTDTFDLYSGRKWGGWRCLLLGRQQ